MTLHKALNPRDDTDYMCQKNKKRIATIKYWVEASIQGLEVYIKKSK